MRIVLEAHSLPGRSFEGYDDVHVALQVRRDPDSAVPGDAASASWETEVEVADGDIRGPAVQGRRGDRFLYLTWGSPSGAGWGMFRRAKLMWSDVDPELVDVAIRESRPLVARVSLTDECGGPRCARVRPPAVEWALGPANRGQRSGGRSL